MKMHVKGDYHVHTHFCPHGSNDEWEKYILMAIELKLEEISFTEHAPLPRSFTDPTPDRDSAMNWADLDLYLKQGQELKLKYQDQIKINIGFEVDFIEGFEEETKAFLDLYGDQIDDAILSVHMLKMPTGGYQCIDYSADVFETIIKAFGSIEAVYHAYYDTVKKAIETDLGMYKPRRTGHLTLVEKFIRKFPVEFDRSKMIEPLLQLIKNKNYALDLNTAGLFKPDCGSIYPNDEIVKKASKLGIELIPGSDSHEASSIARGFQSIEMYL